MINLELAKKIKELRLKNMLTQEELANQTNLSLRTIQRIESGETEPRGDTLKRLANVFEVTPNDLIEWVEQEDRALLVFLNLSALSFIAFPILGLIIPLSIWVLKRHKVRNVEETGKAIINFQITWCILLGLWYASIIGLMLFQSDIRFPSFNLRSYDYNMSGIEIFIIGFPIFLYCYNFFIILFNTFRSYRGKNALYKPSIKFLK
ncbi:MAG: helix-turn-helix domain-containing protein [Bacteroidota bacterium]